MTRIRVQALDVVASLAEQVEQRREDGVLYARSTVQWRTFHNLCQ